MTTTKTAQTTKLKATPELVSAIKAVQPKERLQAARHAEKMFFAALEKLTAFGDFDAATNVEMAFSAAAAEVAYKFA